MTVLQLRRLAGESDTAQAALPAGTSDDGRRAGPTGAADGAAHVPAVADTATDGEHASKAQAAADAMVNSEVLQTRRSMLLAASGSFPASFAACSSGVED